MTKLCAACHGSSWTSGHFASSDSTIIETNPKTLAATQILGQAWEKKMADKANPFDEAIEQQWVRQWLRKLHPVRLCHGRFGSRGIQERMAGADEQPVEDARDRPGGETTVGCRREKCHRAALFPSSFLFPRSIFTW